LLLLDVEIFFFQLFFCICNVLSLNCLGYDETEEYFRGYSTMSNEMRESMGSMLAKNSSLEHYFRKIVEGSEKINMAYEASSAALAAIHRESLLRTRWLV
jgi:hypothetical protein